MPRVEVERVDLKIVIARAKGGGAKVHLVAGGRSWQKVVPRAIVASWLKLPQGAPMPGLETALGLGPPTAAWRQLLLRTETSQAATGPVDRLARLVFEIQDGELDALAWETSLASVLPDWSVPAVVRACPVRPRSLHAPLTLPLRLLQVGLSSSWKLTDQVKQVFGRHPRRAVAEAVQTREITLEDLLQNRPSAQWPSSDVLHFDRLPLPRRQNEVLSTANPRKVGTLGWWTRLLELWQSRLVILCCVDENEAEQARRLATALAARGGPALLVVGPDPQCQTSLTNFYHRLIHDDPLDLALSRSTVGSVARSQPSLFAGAGREESLRVSGVALQLLELEKILVETAKTGRNPFDSDDEVSLLLRRTSSTAQRAAIRQRALRTSLSELRADWDGWRFDMYERDGLLPLSRVVRQARHKAGVDGPRWLRSEPLVPSGPRFVNSSLWASHDGDALSRLDPPGVVLSVGETYQLGIQIGERDLAVTTLGATALLEEVFRWSPKMRGAWVEVGVTGIEFQVLGDPVQELWLPKEGESVSLFFAVVPRKRGIVRLRFCLYYRQSIVQSFLLAAVAWPSELVASQPAPDRLLARTLGLCVRDIEGRGYLTRLEYSLGEVDQLANQRRRTLSVVANDLDGLSVVTLKGKDLFDVRTNQDTKTLVSAVREALAEISTPPRSDIKDSSKWPPGFGKPDYPVAGSESWLKDSLKRLAKAGWALFSQTIPNSDGQRARLAKVLAPEKQRIHVAQMLLEKVIPWSAIYDRPYDADRKTDSQGNPVAHDACLAALPGADGSLPTIRCGVLPTCLLHPAAAEQRRQDNLPLLLADTVACPLHFWGFKHLVEVPAQQVAAGKKGRSASVCVNAGEEVQLVAGIHRGLGLASAHEKELDQLKVAGPAAWKWRHRTGTRDDLLNRLKDSDLDLFYFYGHARGGLAEPSLPRPLLELQEVATAQVGQIKPEALDFDQLWSHHPLVFLNGCGTAAFSPDALSPFIIKLVQDRGASGVLGTEMPVWEQLATEVATKFLTLFLAGNPAGDCLLEVRRWLLAQGNPLGLAYTLYAPVELVLVRTAKPA